MQKKADSRLDLFLLLSLLLVIVLYPVLDHTDLRRATLGALIFVPVILATFRMSQIRHLVWPSVLLMSAAISCAAASNFTSNPVLAELKWLILAAFFGVTVLGLFSYLRNQRTIQDAHLLTAGSIYLLIGMLFFAIYSAIETMHPGSIQQGNSAAVDRSSALLYFSLVTLSTIGYGDIVPVHGEVRMLAALEGITGVLYVAITIALLVSAYGQRGDSR